jgi:hypothetical protein
MLISFTERLGFFAKVHKSAIRSTTGIVALLALLVLAALDQLPKKAAKIDFETTVSESGIVNVYINKLSNVHKSLEISMGDPTSVVLPGLNKDITLLRIDPPKLRNTIMTISDITISDETKVFARINVEKLATWGLNDLEVTQLNEDSIQLKVSGDDPYIFGNPAIQFTSKWMLAGVITDALKELKNGLFIIVVCSLMLFTLVSSLANYNYSFLYSFIPVLGFGLALHWFTSEFFFGFVDVGTGVGRAAFFGKSTINNQLFIFGFIISAILVPLTIASLHSKRLVEMQRSVLILSDSKHLSSGFFFLLLSTLLLLPNAANLNLTSPLAYDWDSQNIQTWAYFIREKYLPIRDFWYPYSGSFVFSFQNPLGATLRLLFEASSLALFVVALRLCFRGLFIGQVLLLVLLLVGHELGLFPGLFRYVTPFSIVLCFLATLSSNGEKTFARMLLTLAITCQLFFEPAGLVYAAPAIPLITAFDAFQRSLKAAIKNCIVSFVPSMVVVSLYLYFLHGIGALLPWLGFLVSLPDQAAYSSVPTSLIDGSQHSLYPFAAAVMILFGVSLLKAVRQEIDELNLVAVGMLAMSTVTVMLLQKHLVRPMGWQLFFVPIVFLYLFFSCDLFRSSHAGKILKGSMVGALTFVLVNSGFISQLSDRLLNAPKNAIALINAYSPNFAKVANGMEGTIEVAEQAKLAKFVKFKNEIELWHQYKGELASPASNMFVLGDNPALYELFDQLPPYHINLYNSSPVFEQQTVTDQLTAKNPQVVFFDRRQASFDLVPNMLRSPLIYQFVAKNYHYYESVGNIDVLRKNKVPSDLDIKYWEKVIGDRINLGFVPAASRLSPSEACRSRNYRCRAVLKIVVSDEINQVRQVNLLFNGKIKYIFFNGVQHRDTYFIPMERIPYYWLNQNLDESISLAAQQLPGIQAEIETYTLDELPLY